MKRNVIVAYAQLNARIGPILRGKRFETPLEKALKRNKFGEVGGGGTMQLKSGEIEYCGIDVDLFDVAKGVPFVCDFLTERGAPKGSKLIYTVDRRRKEILFGDSEGLAIYLNGTDLPDEVYRTSDVNDVFESIHKALGKEGSILNHWQGPTETALYVYGDSAKRMRELIAPAMSAFPLCQRARVERIA